MENKTETLNNLLDRVYKEKKRITLNTVITSNTVREALDIFSENMDIFSFTERLRREGFSDLKIGMIIVLIDDIYGNGELLRKKYGIDTNDIQVDMLSRTTCLLIEEE